MIKYRTGKYIAVLLLLLCSSSIKLFAQVNPDNFAEMVDFMPPPPNASSIIKNGMLSVNKNTGSPNVNIPLYTLKGQKLSTAVSLSYNSTGIKVDEVAGRVGMGWALNAGGVVTRTLRGSPDESNTRITPPATPGLDCNTYTFLDRADRYYPSGGHDAQPDLFNFNMNGHSGSFVFDGSGAAVAINPEQFKIESNFAGGATWNFKITTSDGILYTFGGDAATEKSKRMSSCGRAINDSLANAWYLTEIKHPNGETISFTYTKQAYKYDSGITETKTWASGCGTPTYPLPCMHVVGTRGQLLTTITNNFTTISFSYTSRDDVGDKLVSEVKIKTVADPGTTVGRFVLTYTQETAAFYSAVSVMAGISGITPNKTPYLTGLKEESQGAEYYRQHNFSYYEPHQRPPRCSFAQDHWGYFNGVNNSTLIPPPLDPATSANVPSADAIRTPSESAARKGLLKTITYPTGGTETIEYGINKFYNTSTASHEDVGGLRVTKITTQNPPESAMVKKYYYGELATMNQSSLLSVPNPVYEKNYWVKYSSSDYCEHIGLYSNSLNTLGNYQNNPISYASVIEGYGEDFEGGAAQTKFMVGGDIPPLPMMMSNYIMGQPMTNSSAAYNGKVLEEIIYKKGPSNLFPIKKTVNEWDNDSRLQTKISGYAVNHSKEDMFFNSCPDNYNVENFDWVRFDTWSTWVYLQSTVETQWDENGLNPVTKTTNYTYGDQSHVQVTKIETTDGEGRLVTTELKYPKDFVSGTNVYADMVAANVITPVVNYKQTKNSTPVVEVQTDYWKPSAGNFVPAEIKKSTQGISPLISEGTFDSYDAKGNLLQYTDKSGIVNAIVWGYGHLYPVAKITGSTYAAAIAYLTGGSVTALQTMDGEALLTELNKIRTGLPNAYVTTYTYKHLAGVTTIIDPNNKRSTYLYDSFNRLILVRDQDGNIVKRICYNYQGQVENCNIPSCDYKAPIWQNTATPLRCEIVACAYTGNQQQEQQDVNPCSSTYNAKQWKNAGYNPSACTGTPATITYNSIYSGYTVEYTNTISGITYSFNLNVPPYLGTLGCVPVGTYNIHIYRSTGTPISTTFMVGSNMISGTEATFNNINLRFDNRDVFIGNPL